jgi:hypothetical protein
MNIRGNSPWFLWHAVILISLTVVASIRAAGLHTDVALSPPEGGTIIRAQWRYSEWSNQQSAPDHHVKLNINSITLVHGVTANFTVLGRVPFIQRESDFGMGKTVDDSGFGDLVLLAKYRFYQDDAPSVTTRAAIIAGAEVPTFDGPFSSESIDPIIGVVWTHQRLDWWFDSDLIYKFNTGSGLSRYDVLRCDFATTYRLYADETEALGPIGLYAIGEINAEYMTDGSMLVLGSPGIQLITPRLILEAGVQLPIQQHQSAPRLETDISFVLGLRFQF